MSLIPGRGHQVAGWDPGGEESLLVASPNVCSRIIRGSCILCRCRLRLSVRAGEIAPSPLPEAPAPR